MLANCRVWNYTPVANNVGVQNFQTLAFQFILSSR